MCDDNINVPCIKRNFVPTPGVEPGPAGWKPAILAVRPRGIDVTLTGFVDIYMGMQGQMRIRDM